VAKTLADAGFVQQSGPWDHSRWSQVWRKVAGGRELLATVERSGLVLVDILDGSRNVVGYHNYPDAGAAAADLAARYGTGNDDPTVLPGYSLAEVSWDEFQARRAGGDE
jgi:hypothetical protein